MYGNSVKDAYRHVRYFQVTGGDTCLVATQDNDYFEAEHMLGQLCSSCNGH